VMPPRKQCEPGVKGLQELGLSGQESLIAGDNTKVHISPTFQGITCFLLPDVIYIMVCTLLTIICFHL
jgi:hypothetical protein